MKTSSITRSLAVSALAAAALVPAQPASAAEANSIFLKKGLACPDFNLEFSWTGTITQTKEFVDENGNVVRLLSAGKGTVNTYTNYGTKPGKREAGESLTIRTDGSVTETVYNPDGTQTVTATGHNGLIMFPSDIPAGPSTTHYTGKIVFTIGTDGVFTLISTSGPSIDVCAELAS
ncbi:hypothetical protein [Arthrobacter sp. HMWF013]|uniref:hypothetical protein n=1 Tax=Arthrobacter sp. HMWF013 TaxID=2056849 RepID=UPI000D385DDA|nr:hypothetical protein [Arthrobacter sp. HMWF013]PTT69750.1 hypothetical protein DBR22_02955 [Arthrobacter sp. HMWF013]